MASTIGRLADKRRERHDDVNDPWWIGDTNFALAAFDRFLAALPR